MQFELTKEYLAEIREAVAASNEQRLIELIADVHAADLAEIIDAVETDQAYYILQYVEAEKASEAVAHLDEDERKELLKVYTSAEIAENFIENLESDDAADLIQDLPEDQKESVIAQIDDIDQAGQIVDLLNYEEGTAGAIMGKELVKVNENLTVTESVRQLRKQAEDIENVYTIYVVDDKDRLLGRLSLKKVLVTSPRSKIGEIYQAGIKQVKTTTDQEEVANVMQKYDLVALPVVDEIGRLVGRITIDDVVDVIREEAEKDYQLASGLSEDVESTDSVWMLTRARLPWLLLGMLGGVLGAMVIQLYEHDLIKHAEMAFFIPLVAAMGGNVGVQSSAIIVQGLANNSLGMGSMASKLMKEFGVALLNGLVCSVLLLIYNIFLSGSSLTLTYTVSSALMVVILFAALFGTFVPLVLDRYKVDPALATGPFITTMNDILGLFIYFGIGQYLYSL
ncbi:magnesium transporter [bacterium SCSIO 12741]|nr:magnesium transporter [bacterium SCSIO 12741]